MTTLHAPVYLLRGHTDCYNCHREMPVVAVIANVSDEEDPGDTVMPALVQYISDSADELAGLVQTRHALYQIASSTMAGMTYFANHCPHCGKFSGDHFVYGPDGPFFPYAESQPVEYEILPIQGTIDIDCSPSWGVADQIIESGKLRK